MFFYFVCYLKIELQKKKKSFKSKIKPNYNLKNMENKITLTIEITQQNTICCSYIDSQKKETVIYLQNQHQKYIPLTLSFCDNKIIIGEQHENGIEFMQDLLTNPQEFKTYQFTYQNKEYNVIAEVLFALIVNEFKHQIEKEFIIEETILTFHQTVIIQLTEFK